ncbi:MAG: IS630 transposase-related protein [Trichodesmium sp. St18_bin1]|nr:IS630 transposase-related protein [Trichodesmium sp. St18_bin1]
MPYSLDLRQKAINLVEDGDKITEAARNISDRNSFDI